MNKTILLLIIQVCFLLNTNIIKGQNNLVPNTSDCAGTRPPFAFNIQQKWSVTGISNFCTPLAGDLDGDGKVEVLAMGTSSNIYIYDGATGTSAGTLSVGSLASYRDNPYAICDVEGDGKAELFVIDVAPSIPTATLYTVTSSPGVRPITFGQKWKTNLPTAIRSYSSYGVIPAVADLDGDGMPEFVAAHYILETNGSIVATMNYGGGILGPSDLMSVSYIVDLDNNGIPEIVVGTDVYKYNGTSATLWKRCPSYATSGADGTNMAADINLDGYVDLIYHDTRNKGTGTMVVWTPALSPAPGNTGSGVIGTIPNLQSGYRCYPVVGDIDGIVTNGKKYPEICYNAQNHMYAYSFNGSSFSQKWNMTTNEGSGVATFTFFDFNLDGIVELVYRDEQNLKIMDCQGNTPVNLYTQPATSATVIETPIVADVTGDGSADIIVTGSNRLYVFEGGASKWAACPPVWNQQMYSPLLINTDLTVFQHVASANLTFHTQNGDDVQYYNGGPMQVPYISDETYLPIDISPDIYVVSGTITFNSATSITLTVTFGNQGLITAPSNTPIRYYKNSVASSNIIGNETLGADLAPGQTRTITKVITGLNPMPTQFYVRILDDGTNFPATGAFSDCNLTNNTKSFGTLELHKTVNSLDACIDGTSIFNIELINNTNQSQSPQTFNNVILIDSLGTGWSYISSTAIHGTLGIYNPATRKIQWTVSSIAPGDTARLVILAKSTVAAAIRNTVWVESVNGTILGKEVIEAYVIVNSSQAPPAASVSPANPTICSSGGSVVLTASVGGKSSYQWYRNNVEISGATQQSYTATTSGNYTVTYFEDPCVSQMSDAATVSIKNRATAAIVNVNGTTTVCSGNSVSLTVNNTGGVTNPVYRWYYSSSETTSFHTGANYTTPTLTGNTTYYVSVEGDNFCENLATDRKTVTVTVNPKPSLTSSNISKTDVSCNGGSTGSITVTASGVNAYNKDGGTWQESSTFSGLTAGTYQIRVRTSAGCVSDAVSVTIAQPAVALSATPVVTDLTCNGGVNNGKIVITAGGGTSPYLYSTDSGSSYQTSGTFDNLSIGAYGVMVKDANDCVTTMQTVHVSQPSVFEIPTPVMTPVTCNGGDDGSITVSDVSGGTSPYTYSFDNGTDYISGNSKSGLSAGTYYIRIKDDHGCVSSSVAVTVTESAVLLTSANVSAAVACPNLPATITISNTITGVYSELLYYPPQRANNRQFFVNKKSNTFAKKNDL